jgi:fatty acid desaturase
LHNGNNKADDAARSMVYAETPRQQDIMYWFYVLIVAPLWGMISAQLFMISILSLIFVIAVVGIFKRKVALTNLAIAMAVSFFNCILFVTLLVGGRYLIQKYTSFGSTTSENVAFWVFAVFSVWFMAEEFASKIQKQWRNCTLEGSVELDMLKRLSVGLKRELDAHEDNRR